MPRVGGRRLLTAAAVSALLPMLLIGPLARNAADAAPALPRVRVAAIDSADQLADFSSRDRATGTTGSSPTSPRPAWKSSRPRPAAPPLTTAADSPGNKITQEVVRAYGLSIR